MNYIIRLLYNNSTYPQRRLYPIALYRTNNLHRQYSVLGTVEAELHSMQSNFDWEMHFSTFYSDADRTLSARIHRLATNFQVAWQLEIRNIEISANNVDRNMDYRLKIS